MHSVAAPARNAHPYPALSGDERQAFRRCPGCNGNTAAYTTISTAHLEEPFLTAPLRARLPALIYHKCRTCGSLWANDARCDPAMLRRCYTDTSTAYWAYLRDDERLQARLVGLLDRYAPGRALCDVGCGDGRFLSALPSQWIKHGLEAAPRAVELCRAAGFDVGLGTPAASPRPAAYDAVTCLDTLEHMLDPAAEVAGMAAMLRPGGVLLIVTGDAQAGTARLAGSSWEYLHCVGHVSVLSRAALRKMLIDGGLVIAAHSGMSHSASISLPAWIAAWAGNQWRRARGRKCRRMPYCHDHQLAIAGKPAN